MATLICTCGVCGKQIEDGDNYFAPQNLNSDYLFCSKKCVRTAVIVDAIERLKTTDTHDIINKIKKEFSNG